MVPSSTRASGGVPSEDSSTTRLGINATEAGISDATGGSQLVAWPISGNPMYHEEILHKVQISC